MIYCPHCGTSLPDDSAFCESCGTAIPQSTAYEVPAYEYEAPAYQPAVRTPAAPVWIVALAMLIGMVLNRFLVRYAFLFSGFPNGPTGSFNGNLWTATYYIVIIACSSRSARLRTRLSTATMIPVPAILKIRSMSIRPLL